MSNANSIKVVARFRPQNRTEIEAGGQPIVRFNGLDTCTIDVSEFGFMAREVLCIGSRVTHSPKERKARLPSTAYLICHASNPISSTTPSNLLSMIS